MADDSKTAEYWMEQAEWATEYAHARPAHDLSGFFAALRDAQDFRDLAALATRKTEGA